MQFQSPVCAAHMAPGLDLSLSRHKEARGASALVELEVAVTAWFINSDKHRLI